MSGHINGAQPQQVRVSLTSLGSAARLNYVTSDGKFLGTVTFDAVDPDALRAMANHFQQFAAEQSGGIQLAGASAVPGLRS